MVEDPRHQEALQALGVHSVEIAHELRNLLHRVLSIAECIDTKDLPPKTADALLTLLGGAKACRFLVDDLLTWGRGVGEPAVEFEVAPFLDDTLAMSGLREDRSIELKCVVPAEARAHARPERLRRAILNLLRNARQALADLDLGGRILVTAEMLDDQRL
ncbi:MAG: HAMP domain-containing histidine kinase, partial [Planctomycetes bacterium]|nr:HAMP domain-containing histidine kinase [Planctomycetota bacterium]